MSPECGHNWSLEYVSILVGTMGAQNVFPFFLAQLELGMCFHSCCIANLLNIDDNVLSGNIRFRKLSLLGS